MPLRRLALIISLYLLGFCVLEVSSTFFTPLTSLSIWYLPASLSMVLVLIYGIRAVGLLSIAALLGSIFIYQWPAPAYVHILMALIHMLGYGFCTLILRSLLRSQQLRAAGDAAWFVLAALLIPALVATSNVTLLRATALLPETDFVTAVLTWWIGDAIGVAIGVPLLLVWVIPLLRGEVPLKSILEGFAATRRHPSIIVEGVAQAALAGLIFLFPVNDPSRGLFTPTFFSFPVLSWVALRRGIRGIAIANVLLSIVTIITASGNITTPERLFDIQLLTLAMVLATTLLGSAISEHRHADEALRVSEERFRIISELTSDYTYALRFNEHGTVVAEWFAGAYTRITGCTREELITLESWEAIIHPDDLPGVRKRQHLMYTGRPYEDELRIIHKNGSIRWLHRYIQPVWDEQAGRVTHIYGAVQDITERKRIEEERLTIERALQDRQRLESIGLLAGGIAHDFNNLLVGVLGNAELARLELPPDSPAIESIQQIELAAQRAAELTWQLLAYAGKGRFIIEPLPVNILVEETIQLIKTTLGSQVSLRQRLAPDLPQIEGDATQIRQVLMNILINAAEAIGNQYGEIAIVTSVRTITQSDLAGAAIGDNLPEGEYIAVAITDTGCGMDKETSKRIFEPFFTTKFTGRGLGMAAVQGILQSHNGGLTIISVPGYGSTFTVLFPPYRQKST